MRDARDAKHNDRLKIQSITISGHAGASAWIEIKNDGGETYLGDYQLRIRNGDGSENPLWQGDSEAAIWGLGTIRLTDGSDAAIRSSQAEP